MGNFFKDVWAQVLANCILGGLAIAFTILTPTLRQFAPLSYFMAFLAAFAVGALSFLLVGKAKRVWWPNNDSHLLTNASTMLMEKVDACYGQRLTAVETAIADANLDKRVSSLEAVNEKSPFYDPHSIGSKYDQLVRNVGKTDGRINAVAGIFQIDVARKRIVDCRSQIDADWKEIVKCVGSELNEERALRNIKNFEARTVGSVSSLNRECGLQIVAGGYPNFSQNPLSPVPDEGSILNPKLLGEFRRAYDVYRTTANALIKANDTLHWTRKEKLREGLGLGSAGDLPKIHT